MMEKQQKDVMPSWVAVVRSPEEGRRRKQCAEELGKMRKVLGDGYECERSGMILKGCAEIMKYSVDAGWQKKGWDIAALNWDEVMEKLRRT